MQAYLTLLAKWNKVTNLTAITPSDMQTHHINDSLSVLPYIKGHTLADVGTGAGLPGIPLAIERPDLHVCLIERNHKKVHFLLHVKQKLGLSNIEIIDKPCQDYHPQTTFDNVITRAFSAIPDSLALCQHLCAPDGQFLFMKGQYPEQELSHLSSDFRVQSAHALKVPGLEAARHLICIEFNNGVKSD